MEATANWLSGVGEWAWHASLALGIVLNAVFFMTVGLTRDRRLVDRYTSPWLAANCALIGFGAGVPALAWCLRLAVNALPTFSLLK